MNKTQFNELYNYLQNRPAEAVRFLDMLEKAKIKQCDTIQSSCEAGEEIGRNTIISTNAYYEHSGADSMRGWLTVKQIGEEIGMGRTWVKGHMRYLPDEWKRQVGMTGKWMLHPMSISAMRRLINN